MKCPYCGSTVIIPESLRTPPPSAGPTIGEAFQFGLNGVDLNKIMGNAMNLPRAISLAQQGRIDEAANLYSQLTGMEHGDAVKAVSDMAAGHAVSLTPGRTGATWRQFQTSYSQPSVEIDTGPVSSGSSETVTTGGGRSCCLLIGIVVAVAVVIAVLAGGGLMLFSGGKSGASVLPIGFAHRTLMFGSEGIGQGMFQDPRAIGVDADGNLTVSDFQDGRVQTFDSTGKFLSSFSLSPDGKKVYVSSMAVGRDGKIYVVHSSKIHVYDQKGNEVDTFGDNENTYDQVAVGGDGKLYAIADQESIVRLTPDGNVDLSIPDTFTKVAGDMDIDTHVAADGLGNMYIVGAFHYLVLKYSPQGDYLDQFGGEAKAGASNQPGKFTSPSAIAVDGYGRVYVSDFWGIQVFDSDGTYLNLIPMDQGVAFGMTFDDQNNLYLVTNQNHVMKFAVQPPANK
jgi:sugar lactone lactonase YvrE